MITLSIPEISTTAGELNDGVVIGKINQSNPVAVLLGETAVSLAQVLRKAVTAIGSTWVDYTTQATDASTGDFPPFGAASDMSAGDAIYIRTVNDVDAHSFYFQIATACGGDSTMRTVYNIIYLPKNSTEDAAVPTGALVIKSGESEVKVKLAGGIESMATTSTVASAVAQITIKDWQASTAVILNEVRRATVSAGTIELGDLIRSNSGRTTGGTFDATEAGNWTEFTPDIVTSVAGKTGIVSLVKGDVGLGSADNTADTAKPVSTAQQTALDGKSATTHAHTGTYEPANTNIQSHVTAAHAPATAEMNVSPDWNAASGDAQILNKPTIPAATVINNTLTSVSTTEALSAAQGKALQDGKQATLVSGTTIKTLNSTSLLGSGDIAITQTITNTTAPILTGSSVLSVLTVLATTDWDKQIPVDASSGNIAIQLPTAVGNSGKSIRIVRLDSSINTVTVYARYDEGIGGIQTGADAIGIKATGTITIKSNGTQPVLAAWENPASVSRLWLPNDLAGQVGWYRPDGLSAGSLATWTDAFGLNNITATGTAPTVATGGQNGYAKIGFNGASNMLSVGSVNLDTLTIMGIFTPIAAAYHNILRGNNTNGFSLGSNNNNPMTLVMGQRGVVNFTASTATWAIGSPALFGATYDAAGVYTYYKDGANGGTATDNRLMATQPMDIASNTNMDYYEQIIYTTVQVVADIDRLSGYLAHKYSLTANLAGGHTYKTLPPLVSLATY